MRRRSRLRHRVFISEWRGRYLNLPLRFNRGARLIREHWRLRTHCRSAGTLRIVPSAYTVCRARALATRGVPALPMGVPAKCRPLFVVVFATVYFSFLELWVPYLLRYALQFVLVTPKLVICCPTEGRLFLWFHGLHWFQLAVFLFAKVFRKPVTLR